MEPSLYNPLLSLGIAGIMAGLNSCHSTNGKEDATALKPNIVIFLSDDQGWGDYSINGNRNLHTPNIDQLATNGAMFSHFFVCPVSSPTRAELLTGRYNPRSGVFSTSQGGERMNLGETTIAEVFKNGGYKTAAFGKWHNGMQYPYHPAGRGFDEFYGFCSGHWGDYFSPPLEHNGKIVQGEGYLTDDLTNKAMAFIEQHKDNPFFVYIPYNTPHSPFQVPDIWWDKFKDKKLEMLNATHPDGEKIEETRAALAMCENIDWNVGRVIEKLKELHLYKNTIVIYFNDNGPNTWRWNGGMKGRKGSTDEGGVRSPLFIQWPGIIKAGQKISEIASVTDLLPTLADLAGIEAKTVNPPDGISLKPLLMNDNAEWEDRIIYSHWNNQSSARNQKYRFDFTNNLLFDMDADPGQINNIAPDMPALAQWFKTRVEESRADVFSRVTDLNRPFTVGHPDFKYTQLPARDGKAFGGIKRSAQSPNSTFFTSWKKLSDRITFDVDVLEEGDFEAEIYYTCAPGDEGASIQLSFGDNRLTTIMSRVYDPPLRGKENDRVLRTQSYVKDFIPHNAGVIHLNKGKGELTLQALEIPGSQVVDFRLLMLTRVN